MKPTAFFLYDYVFPNYILPNATPPEMGIINYIHTLYCNNLKTESFFDINLESPESNMSLIFDDKIGSWPNSINHNGTYFKSSCMKPYINVIENSVFHGKRNKTNKYIYSIKVTPHISKFTGLDYFGSRLNGEHFWKHISEEVMEDARKGKATILLEWCNESVIERHEFILLNESIKISGIPKNQVILVMNGNNSSEIYNSYIAEKDQSFLVYNIPFLAIDICHHYKNSDYGLKLKDFLDTKSIVRKHYFVFPNRRNRSYRIAMLTKLFSDGTLNKGNWSCLDKFPDYKPFMHNLEVSDETIDEFRKIVPKTLEQEPNACFNNVFGNQDISSLWNKESYFYIASETFMKSEYKSFTEKIFKPIINFQPFVFLAFPGALLELRKMGFKTFDPFIDESYDLIENQNERIQKIYEEIVKLCSLTKEEIHAWYWSMEDILIHNHNHAMKFSLNDENSKKFFTELGLRCL